MMESLSTWQFAWPWLLLALPMPWLLAWLLPPIVISLFVRVAKAVFSIVKYIKQIIPFAG